MDELFLGFFFCVVPVAGLLGVVALIVKATSKPTESTSLDAEVFKLRGEKAQLEQRVVRLEQAMNVLWHAHQTGASAAPAAHEYEDEDEEYEDEYEDDEYEEDEYEDDAQGSDVAAAPSSVAAPVASAPLLTWDDAAARSTVPDALPQAEAPAAASSPAEPTDAGEASSTAADAAASTAAPTEPAAPPAASAPPPATAAPASPPAPEKPAFSLEQWVGVRGAAALGASILVLAGVYFFEYSIEHGLITPAMRMIAGTLVGLVCVAGAELRLRRDYTVLANWLAGAGVGILYVAFWAGRALYELYPMWAATLLMIATTAACVTLAVKRDAPAIAVLGLLGGFMTPLALSTGSDRPYALFGYLLLLDGAMLWVAYQRRWSWLALLCLVGTSAYQGVWLFGRLDEPRLLLGVGIVGLFGLVFAALPKRAGEESGHSESALWRLTRSAGVCLPMLFTIGLAARSSLGHAFWPTVAQLVLLTVAAGFVSIRQRTPGLAVGAALLASGAMLTWSVVHPPTAALGVWQLVGLGLGLLLVHVAIAELARWRAPSVLAPASAAVFGGSMLSLGLVAAPFLSAAGPWPWCVVWAAGLGVGAVLGRHERWAGIRPVAAALVSLGLSLSFCIQVGNDGQPGGPVYLGLVVGFALLASLLGLIGKGAARRWGDHAGATFALVALPVIVCMHDVFLLESWVFFAATLLLACLALFASARRGQPAWMVGTLVALTASHGLWVLRRDPSVGFVELIGVGLGVLLLALFPIVAPRRLREMKWSWRTAALAGPAGLLTLRHLYLETLGASTLGLLPIALGLVSLGAATAVRLRGPDSAEARRVATVWLVTSAAAFVTLAIPMQLENEWLTIGWALEGVVLTALWRRMDHAGLKYFAFALAAAVATRLVFNPYVLEYGARGWPILNWIAYTYLIPVACLVAMWWMTHGVEVGRRRSWERSFLGEFEVFTTFAAAAAILVGFVWINLAIIDVFSTGRELTLPSERLPARDLSLSIAWAVYALFLLGLGMWRKNTALRGTSLALILITCGKAFVYDLAHLSDLYRVASLVGLALSLIVISIAYQRFVFRKPPEEPPS